MYLNENELRLVVYVLNEFRNKLIAEGRYTDCVDDLLIKAAGAKTVKMKYDNGGNDNGKIIL